MTQQSARQGRSPFRRMVLGSVAFGSAGAVLTAGVLGAVRGGDGLVAALLGGATALVILLVGLFTDRKRLLHDIALGTVPVRASRWYGMIG